MIWSLIKIFVFVGLAAAVAVGVGWVLETPGEISVSFAGREWFMSPMGFVISLAVLFGVTWVLIKLFNLLEAVIRFLLGDETAINRFFSRSRERKGFNALSDSMIALAAGDADTAQKKSAKAQKLLGRSDVTSIISAKAAEQKGDSGKAQALYRTMLEDDRTRFVGITGLMDQKLEAGDNATALALGKKAFALQPSNPALLTQLFELQSQEEDWAGARSTLNATMHARLLPRDVSHRRDAVLSLADARAAEEKGDKSRRDAAALQAVKLAPTLIPAVALAAKVHIENNAKRKATRLLTKTWAANPHPDLGAVFASIAPDETPAQRNKRFQSLTSSTAGHSESKLLLTELALAAEDFPGARKALGDLAETEPTTRSLTLMAAIERGQGSSEAVVRGWLAKALDSSRGPQWVCDKCGNVHASWGPVCDNCGAFDTLTWKTPENEITGQNQSITLPLIIGPSAEEEAEAEDLSADDAEPVVVEEEVVDLEPEAPPRPDAAGSKLPNS